MQRWLPRALAGLLALPPSAARKHPLPADHSAQTAPVAQPATVQSLKVIPLAGNQEMNDLERKVMAPLVVQVVDQNDQPVEGADVSIPFPSWRAQRQLPRPEKRPNVPDQCRRPGGRHGLDGQRESGNLSSSGDGFPRQRTGFRDHFHDQRDPDHRPRKDSGEKLVVFEVGQDRHHCRRSRSRRGDYSGDSRLRLERSSGHHRDAGFSDHWGPPIERCAERSCWLPPFRRSVPFVHNHRLSPGQSRDLHSMHPPGAFALSSASSDPLRLGRLF